jgi:hypothetical protein
MINELVKCYTWIKVSYGADNWALGEEYRIYLESYEMCCWIEKELIRTDSNKGDEVLYGVKRERYIQHTRKRGTANFIGHNLRRNCLLNCVNEGKIERTRRRGRKRKQLFHGPTEKSRESGNWKRKHLIALSGVLVLEEAMELSQDGLRDDPPYGCCVVTLFCFQKTTQKHETSSHMQTSGTRRNYTIILLDDGLNVVTVAWLKQCCNQHSAAPNHTAETWTIVFCTANNLEPGQLVGIVIALWNGGPFKRALGPTDPRSQRIPKAFSRVHGGHGIKMANFLHLVTRLRITGAKPPLELIPRFPPVTFWRTTYG